MLNDQVQYAWHECSYTNLNSHHLEASQGEVAKSPSIKNLVSALKAPDIDIVVED